MVSYVEEQVRLVDEAPRGGLFRGGFAGLRAAYREWRYERDLRAISRTLHRLSDRRLSMIGLSKTTLDLDIERMALRADRVRAALPPPRDGAGETPALPR